MKKKKKGKISKGRKIERVKQEKCSHQRTVVEKETAEGKKIPWLSNAKFGKGNHFTSGFAREGQTRVVWMRVNACYKILERRGLAAAALGQARVHPNSSVLEREAPECF